MSISKSLLISTVVLLSVSCASNTADSIQQSDKSPISLPAVPSVLVDDNERNLYMLEHYWHGFHWSDTTIIGTDALSSVFNQWCGYLFSVPEISASRTTHHIITDGTGYPDMQLALFALAESVLNNPNSPYRNEELFIPILEAVTVDPSIPEINKARPTYLLQHHSKNRKGTKASDLQLTQIDGAQISLHRYLSSNANAKYTLLYFFNQDCNDCERVGEIIKTDKTICTMSKNGILNIVAIYPDEDLTSWNAHLADAYPSTWLVGRLATDKQRDKYYLPAIPSLYLLDNHLQIILKDAPVETLIQSLSNLPSLSC